MDLSLLISLISLFTAIIALFVAVRHNIKSYTPIIRVERNYSVYDGM